MLFRSFNEVRHNRTDLHRPAGITDEPARTIVVPGVSAPEPSRCRIVLPRFQLGVGENLVFVPPCGVSALSSVGLGARFLSAVADRRGCAMGTVSLSQCLYAAMCAPGAPHGDVDAQDARQFTRGAVAQALAARAAACRTPVSAQMRLTR